MRVSKRVLLGTALACVVMAGMLTRAVWADQRGDEAQPWMVGKCYRVLFLDPAQQQTLRVLENPVGPWVRVQSDPRSPRVPGASPRGRVWLNTATVFAVEEVECSSFPGD